MSLFPNRDWSYIKTKLSRLPTIIFLPDEHDGSGESPRDEDEDAEHQPVPPAPPHQQRPKPRRHGTLPNSRYTRTRTTSDFFEANRDDASAIAADADADAMPPTGRPGPQRGGSPSASAFATAALKEGVPPHVIDRLMRAVGVGGEGAGNAASAGGAAVSTAAGVGEDAVVEDLFAAAGRGDPGGLDERQRHGMFHRRVSPAVEENNNNGSNNYPHHDGNDFNGGDRGGDSGSELDVREAWSSGQPAMPVMSAVPVVSEPADDGRGRRLAPTGVEVWRPWKPGDDSQSPPPRRRSQASDDSRHYGHGRGSDDRQQQQQQLGRSREGELRRTIINDGDTLLRHPRNGGSSRYRGRDGSREGGSDGNPGTWSGRNRREGRGELARLPPLSSRRDDGPSPPRSRRYRGDYLDDDEDQDDPIRAFPRDADSPAWRNDNAPRGAASFETASKRRRRSPTGEANAHDGAASTISTRHGGLERRDSSYDPDQFDPDAYDPGEVTVKRDETTGTPRLTATATAHLRAAVRERRERSASASLTRADGGGGRRDRWPTLSRSRSRSAGSSSGTAGGGGRRVGDGARRSDLGSGGSVGRGGARRRDGRRRDSSGDSG